MIQSSTIQGSTARLVAARAALTTGRRHGGRMLARHRRLVIAVLLGLAVALVVRERALPDATARVMVTTRAVAAGEPLAGATAVIDAPDHPATSAALPPDDRSGAFASHPLTAGELVTRSDATRLQVPPGQVAVPVPISAEFRAWIDAGDELLLYPVGGTADLALLPLSDDHGPVQPLGPVRVLRTEPDTSAASHDGSEPASILVLVDTDQAPWIAEASAAGWILPALMP